MCGQAGKIVQKKKKKTISLNFLEDYRENILKICLPTSYILHKTDDLILQSMNK